MFKCCIFFKYLMDFSSIYTMNRRRNFHIFVIPLSKICFITLP